MTYKETVKELNAMKNSNEMMFRMAISHLMDVGIRHLTAENIEYTCNELMKQDDSQMFASNKFQCEIVRTAGKLAQYDHLYLLTYISENVKYDVS